MRGVEQIPFLYDAMMAVAEATGFRVWRERLVRGAHGRILDLGCGTGRNLPYYRDSCAVTAVDVRIELLMAARQRTTAGTPLVVAAAEHLPFPDRIFDTVVSGLVFCSVAHPDQGLREIRRVLMPSGRLRMLEHVRSTRTWFARWQDLIQPAWTWISGGCHPNRDTEAAVRSAGFRILSEGYRARRNVRLFQAAPDATAGRTDS